MRAHENPFRQDHDQRHGAAEPVCPVRHVGRHVRRTRAGPGRSWPNVTGSWHGAGSASSLPGMPSCGSTESRRAGPWAPTRDDLAPDCEELCDAVHARGRQALHAARAYRRPGAGGDRNAAACAVRVEAPHYAGIASEMTPQDIAEVVAAFGESAGRAGSGGFDAVQIHAAHGYLINQFLSPNTNRQDRWVRRQHREPVPLSARGLPQRAERRWGRLSRLVKLNGSDFMQRRPEHRGCCVCGPRP